MGVLTFVVTVFYQVFPFLSSGNGPLEQIPLGLNVPVPGVQFRPYTSDIADQLPIQPKPNPNFVCHYPSLLGWEQCNGPNSRNCWLRDTKTKQPIFSQFDVETDYELLWPPGITREYWLEVDTATISPDGFPKAGQVFNGSFPGPSIEACWGDDLVIHVTNKLPTNGTTIHWHGIRQLHTNDADGVNGVTQCPIAGDNQTYTYRFKALQYGHTWYHSHYSLQYPNGVVGPLLIHGPSSANWDIAWDPIFVQDWVHEDAFTEFILELTGPPLPSSDSVLLGGVGLFDEGGSRFIKTVPKGKRILIRLINTSSDEHFVVSIDNHTMEVIETDFVPIEPYKTDSLAIAIGQRYSIIVETDQPVDNYWIRTSPAQGCSSNVTAVDVRTGILRYERAPSNLPTTTMQPNINVTCEDEPLASLKPVVRWEVGSSPANNVTDSTYEVGLQQSRGFARWTIGENPLFLNFSDPTLLSLHNNTFNPDYDVYKYDFDNKWVYLVVTGNASLIKPVPGLDNSTRTFAAVAHPLHMHGHDFAILGRGSEPYNEDTDPLTFNLHNPPRRDVALMPANGWIALAFRSDNPGVWLLHCHIAWHASSGLALQLLERQEEILGVLGPQRVAATERTCLGWDTWLKDGEKIDQEDSGI